MQIAETIFPHPWLKTNATLSTWKLLGKRKTNEAFRLPIMRNFCSYLKESFVSNSLTWTNNFLVLNVCRQNFLGTCQVIPLE